MPGGSFADSSGTSMATPHVTGIAALLRSQDASRIGARRRISFSPGALLPVDERRDAHGPARGRPRRVTCSNSPVSSVLTIPDRPRGRRGEHPSRPSSITCGQASGPVAVSPGGGGPIALHDDGDRRPDAMPAVGDGGRVFSGTWTPSGPRPSRNAGRCSPRRPAAPLSLRRRSRWNGPPRPASSRPRAGAHLGDDGRAISPEVRRDRGGRALHLVDRGESRRTAGGTRA